MKELFVSKTMARVGRARGPAARHPAPTASSDRGRSAGARAGAPLRVTPLENKQDVRPYRENVVGFILNRRNDVLIMKRAGARWHWQLPQGGVERNETKRQAVLREMREETGLRGLRIISVVENFHVYDWPKAPLYAGD